MFYYPQPLKVTSLTMYNRNDVNCSPVSGYVLGSNDNIEWTELCYWTNTNQASRGTWVISVQSLGYYKYHKLQMTDWKYGTYSGSIGEIGIQAVYRYTFPDYYNTWVSHKSSSFFIKY